MAVVFSVPAVALDHVLACVRHGVHAVVGTTGWTEERLDDFLKGPSALCPGNRMDFVGDASATERGAIISYLSTLR